MVLESLPSKFGAREKLAVCRKAFQPYTHKCGVIQFVLSLDFLRHIQSPAALATKRRLLELPHQSTRQHAISRPRLRLV
jgi:hypothetical protein